MRLSDDQVIDRIRDALSEWADEEPIPEPPPLALGEVSPTFDDVIFAPPTEERGRAWLLAAAAAVVLIGLVAIPAIPAIRSDAPMSVVVGPASSSVIEIPVARSFGVRGLEVTDDAVWVTSVYDEQLYRVDPVTNRITETFSIPSHIEGVRGVGQSLWLSRYEPNEAIRLDPETGVLTNRLAFDSQPGFATDGERLWVIAERRGEGIVVEIDPETGTEITQIPLGAAPGFSAFDEGNLWVAGQGTTTVSRIDLAGGRVTAVVDVGEEPRGVVAASGAIWTSVNLAGPERIGSVVRIDPSSAEVTATIETGRWIHSLAVDDEVVWATNFDDGTLSIIDARSATLVATTPIGNRPGGVVVGHGSVWVTPHRRNVLMRIDPSQPLEAAAVPDLARTVDLDTGTVYMRCSGSGSPTVVLTGDQAEGVANAVVEARLSRETRVCAYEPVGIADRDQAGTGGPAATVAADLAEALDVVGERGPFIVVGTGQWTEGLDARMFAAGYRDDVVGLVLVNPASADYLQRLRGVLPAEARERFDESLRPGGDLQWLEESSAQAAATDGLGDLPLIVLSDPALDWSVAAATSAPILTVAESKAISQVLQDTRREQAALSTAGRLIVAGGESITADDVVDAVMSLLR